MAHVAVLGSGVAGLGAALALRAAGCSVTVLTHRPLQHSVSWVAGALWEYPPYMSGGDAAAAGRWALATAEGLEGFLDHAPEHAQAGLARTRCVSLFRDGAPSATRAMWDEQRRACRGWTEGDAAAATAAADTQGLNLAGVTHYTAYDAYTLDPPLFLPWLRARLLADGVRFADVSTPIASFRQAATAAAQACGEPCRAVVNSAGLAAAALAGEPAESMCAVQGDIVVVQANDYTASSRASAAAAAATLTSTPTSMQAAHSEQSAMATEDGKPSPHSSSCDALAGRVCADRAVNDEQNPRGLVYAIPRRGGRVVVGGTSRAVPHAGANPDVRLPVATECADALLKAACSSMPMLASAEESQLVSGLRPVRSGGVRVERQDDGELIIVHNYGHGGSGLTCFIGTGLDAAALVLEGLA